MRFTHANCGFASDHAIFDSTLPPLLSNPSSTSFFTVNLDSSLMDCNINRQSMPSPAAVLRPICRSTLPISVVPTRFSTWQVISSNCLQGFDVSGPKSNTRSKSAATLVQLSTQLHQTNYPTTPNQLTSPDSQLVVPILPDTQDQSSTQIPSIHQDQLPTSKSPKSPNNHKNPNRLPSALVSALTFSPKQSAIKLTLKDPLGRVVMDI